MHTAKHARLEYHTQLTKMSFDELLGVAAGVYFRFFVKTSPERSLKTKIERKTVGSCLVLILVFILTLIFDDCFDVCVGQWMELYM